MIPTSIVGIGRQILSQGLRQEVVHAGQTRGRHGRVVLLENARVELG